MFAQFPISMRPALFTILLVIPSRLHADEITELVVFGASQPLRSATNGSAWVDYLADDLGVPIKNFAIGGQVTAGQHRSQIDSYLRRDEPMPGSLFISSHWGWAGTVTGESPSHAAAGALRNIETLAEAGATQFLLSTLDPLPILAPGIRDQPNAEQLYLDAVSAQEQVFAAIPCLVATMDLTVYHTDKAHLFQEIIEDPSAFGLTNVTDPVRGTGDDPDEYLWWDDLHWTTAVHRLVADRALESILSQPVVGDFDGSGELEVADVNLLLTKIAAGTHDVAFDLTDDQLVDGDDLTLWVKDLRNTWFGDANLDGEFNSTDLIEVFQIGAYERDVDAGWNGGDWTADLRFDTTDLVAAFQDGGYERGVLQTVSAVPEPASFLMLVVGLIGIVVRRRQQVHDAAKTSRLLNIESSAINIHATLGTSTHEDRTACQATLVRVLVDDARGRFEQLRIGWKHHLQCCPA